MSKEITQYEAAGLDEKMRYVQTLSSAGDLIPRGLHHAGKPSPGKVLLVCETGAMLGIHPMAAIAGINVIEGRATISPALMSGLIRKAGHKLRVSTTGTVEGGDFMATAKLTRADDLEFTYEVSWTPARAARAGLCKYEQKGNKWVVTARSSKGNALPWEAYTEALCKARAIGEVAREGAEDCLMGVQYTPEEMGALVTDAGEMVATVEKAEPSEDWVTLVGDATTTAELMEIRDRASAADEYTANRALFLAKAGELSRATADANIVDADVVEDEPTEPAAPAETDEEAHERNAAAEYAEEVAANG